MFTGVETIKKEIDQYQIDNPEQLEAFRISYLSAKGKVRTLFGEIKQYGPEEKKAFGQAVNEVKNLAEEKFRLAQEALQSKNGHQKKHTIDLTLPSLAEEIGSIHPLRIVQNQIVSIFERIGFNLSEGPEIEDDFHNFTALNFPENHPAREMQDTFFIEKNPDIALRTHTSSVQVRVMETQKPPIRTLSPGRVYRNEAISARAHCVFHQIEGLYVDKKVSFVDLKQTLLYFAREMFGKDTQIRLRPSFFPFTEPSAELDIYWGLKTEADKRITKGTGWLEIGGCGMVDVNVFKNCGIDPEQYTGFAFGVGIERITMLKYKIEDLRLFTENDKRFLGQFKGIM